MFHNNSLKSSFRSWTTWTLIILSSAFIALACQRRFSRKPPSFPYAAIELSDTLCEDLTSFKLKEVDEGKLRAEMRAIDDSFDLILDCQKKKTSFPHQLLASEVAMLESYIGFGYKKINRLLRENRCQDIFLTSRVLASATNKLEGVKGIFFRRFSLDPAQINTLFQEGSIWKSSSFLSTTHDFATANRFDGNIMFRIENGHGSSLEGHPISSVEKEVLLNPGATFVVIKVEKTYFPATMFAPEEKHATLITLQQVSKTAHESYREIPQL